MKLGIDIVGVDRFRALLNRSPGFAGRFFTGAELDYCRHTPDPPLRLAGTFAAKEAVMKALDLTPAPAWSRRIEVTRAENGAPRARVCGRDVSVSISHDGQWAIAVAVLASVPRDAADLFATLDSFRCHRRQSD